MKMGLVRRGYSPTGGAEAYLRRFADAAVAAGHSCVLFASEWPEGAWARERVQLAGKSPREFADALAASKPRERCDFLFSLERVWQCDAYRAGDGVHAAWLARRAEFEPAWRSFFRRFSGKHRGLLEIERALFSPGGAGVVIANSKWIKREIEQQFGFPPERIHVVYNGVPAFSPPPNARTEVRAELGLGAEDYVMLFAGSGWDRKGLRFAIDAVNASTVKPTLLVAGRGNESAMPSSDRVRFLGPIADMSRVLAAADAFILPTLYEPFSNACLEALAAGLPVLTTEQNGFAEIIERGVEGEVFADPRDTAALAAGIDRWADAARRAEVRPRLLEKAARFTIEENVRSTLAILENQRESGRTA